MSSNNAIFDDDTDFEWVDDEISLDFEFLENLWFFVTSKHKDKDVCKIVLLKMAEKLEKSGDLESSSIDDFLISIGFEKRPRKPKPMKGPRPSSSC